MHILLLRSNNPVKRIRPNLVSTSEAWIPEKQFHEFVTLARPACLARVLRGQLTKFTRNNPGDSQSQCKLKPQRVSPARTDLSLVNTYHLFTFRSWTLMRKYYSKHLSQNCGNSPQSALDDHQNHSENIINSVRVESEKQENLPVPVIPQLLCTPRDLHPGLFQLALLLQEKS